MAPRALGSTTGPRWKYGPERTWQGPPGAGSPWLGQPGGTGLLRLLWPAGNGLGGPVARGPGPQQSAAYDESRGRRVVVEHRLARLAHPGIRQSRYFGRAKTKFQLYLAATVAGLTLVAGKLVRSGRAGSGRRRFSNCCTTRTDATLSVFDFLRVRFGQVLTPVLLAPTALLKYISPKRLSGQISSHCCLGGSENVPRRL